LTVCSICPPDKRLLKELSALNHLSRVSCNDRPSLDIFHGHSSGSDDRPLANCYARADEGIGTNPSLVLNDDGWFEERQIELSIIVGP
jgi:hypothetical protein